MLAKDLAHLGCLESQLTRGYKEEGLDLGLVHVDLLQRRDDEGSGLASAVLGTGKDIALGEGGGDSFFLNG